MNQACIELLDEIAPFRGFLAPLKGLSQTKESGVSLYEDEEMVYLEAPLPGVKPEDIQVSFDRRGVSIEGKGEVEKTGVKIHLMGSRSFSYWIPLPPGRVDEHGSVEAVSKDGVLKLKFQKSRAAKPLKILVKSA